MRWIILSLLLHCGIFGSSEKALEEKTREDEILIESATCPPLLDTLQFDVELVHVDAFLQKSRTEIVR
jgi:hypothetical protein